MEKLDVFNCSNVFIASYFTDDRGCAHYNREHTLIYLRSGELEITDNGHKTIMHPGDCAFMRRNNRLWLQKRVKKGVPYSSVVLKFSREYLREVYKSLNREEIPGHARRNPENLHLMPSERNDLRVLFESVTPFFDAGIIPSDEVLKQKMAEGVNAVLQTDEGMYASLFDFIDPWKIDIIDFLENNYMNELSMSEIAHFTGRSLSTFKRDFRRISDLTPEKWLIKRRLVAARELLGRGARKVSDVCFEVGFKNLSHFSKIYKETFGMAPTGHM